MNDSELLECATEFIVEWRGQIIHISRYNNHGRFLENGNWCVASWKSPYRDTTNVFYLGADGVWRYKNGCVFSNFKAALDFLQHGACRPGTNGWHQIAENPHEKYEKEAA